MLFLSSRSGEYSFYFAFLNFFNVQESPLLVQSTVCMSLLQPQRETYNLFDDVMLLAEGNQAQPDHSLASRPSVPSLSTSACEVL